MKLMKLFLLTTAAVAAISCVKENLPTENGNTDVVLVHKTFKASYAPSVDAETKVAYENGATVWKEGDIIKVISRETGEAYDFTATEISNGGKSATFEGLADEADQYYGVYPASAYKGTPEYILKTDEKGAAAGCLLVEVPAVQQAVAGTFHESALLCIANSKGNKLNFKHSCAFLKFTLAEPEGIKSVRLAVNGSNNVAGVGNVGINATDMNPKYASSDSNQSAFNMITLTAPEGGFEDNTDYFIAMRANSCPNGITAYIEYEDRVMSRTGNKKVYEDGSIGKIKKLGQLDKDLTALSPYETYNFGANIVIGNKIINKATTGQATLINENTTISTNGVYFINESAEVSLNQASGQYLTLYIINNQSSRRSKLIIKDNIRWTKNGTICLKGMDLTDDASGKTMFQSNSTQGSFVIENCSIPTPKNTQFIYTGHTTEDITICDCDIKIEAAGKVLINGNSQEITSCTLENNIVYSPGEDIATFKLIANTPNISTLNLNKNTIANIFSSTTSNEDYCKVASIETFNCNNNLFYLPSYSDGRYLYITKIIPTNLNQADNFLHKTVSSNSRMRVIYEGNPKVADIWVTTKKIASDVVTSVDLANGVIVPATTTGATR